MKWRYIKIGLVIVVISLVIFGVNNHLNQIIGPVDFKELNETFEVPDGETPLTIETSWCSMTLPPGFAYFPLRTKNGVGKSGALIREGVKINLNYGTDEPNYDTDERDGWSTTRENSPNYWVYERQRNDVLGMQIPVQGKMKYPLTFLPSAHVALYKVELLEMLETIEFK